MAQGRRRNAQSHAPHANGALRRTRFADHGIGYLLLLRGRRRPTHGVLQARQGPRRIRVVSSSADSGRRVRLLSPCRPSQSEQDQGWRRRHKTVPSGSIHWLITVRLARTGVQYRYEQRRAQSQGTASDRQRDRQVRAQRDRVCREPGPAVHTGVPGAVRVLPAVQPVMRCATCRSDEQAHVATHKSSNGTKCACSHGARYHQIKDGYRQQCSQCECSKHHYKVQS